MKATLPLFLLCFGLAATPSSAQQWTRFRGPGGAGLSDAKTIPVHFELDDANWRVRLAGKGHSSPVVWGDRIFLTCDGNQSDRRYLVCHSVDSGEELWRAEDRFEPHRQHKLNSFSCSTPAVDAERVYVAWTSGQRKWVKAYDHQGDELWSRDIGSFQAQHGSGISPVLAGDIVVVGNDNEGSKSLLAGLNKKNGSIAWTIPRESSRASYATPIEWKSGGTEGLIFASTSHGLTLVDPATGKVIWEVDPGFEQRCVGSPVASGDIVFIAAGSGGGGKESLAIRVADSREAKPSEAYRVRRSLPYVPAPIAYQGHLFFWNDGGILSCVRAEDGETLWQQRVDGSFFGSPVCVDGKMYAISRSGELFVVAAAETFQLLSRVNLQEPSQATPAVADGVMYLRTETHLISIGGKTEGQHP